MWTSALFVVLAAMIGLVSLYEMAACDSPRGVRAHLDHLLRLVTVALAVHLVASVLHTTNPLPFAACLPLLVWLALILGVRRSLLVLGVLWTLPNTLIGLCVSVIALLAGAGGYFSRRDMAIVITHFPWGPGGAVTLGNVIITTTPSLDVEAHTYDGTARMRLGDHERGHVLQYMVLGPLFLPIYALRGIAKANNPFERAADRYARTGAGWWP